MQLQTYDINIQLDQYTYRYYFHPLVYVFSRNPFSLKFKLGSSKIHGWLIPFELTEKLMTARGWKKLKDTGMKCAQR